MADRAVEVVVAGQHDEVVHGLRRGGRVEGDRVRTEVGRDLCRVGLRRVDAHRRRGGEGHDPWRRAVGGGARRLLAGGQGDGRDRRRRESAVAARWSPPDRPRPLVVGTSSRRRRRCRRGVRNAIRKIRAISTGSPTPIRTTRLRVLPRLCLLGHLLETQLSVGLLPFTLGGSHEGGRLLARYPAPASDR